jgi:hypothetical protein
MDVGFAVVFLMAGYDFVVGFFLRIVVFGGPGPTG